MFINNTTLTFHMSSFSSTLFYYRTVSSNVAAVGGMRLVTYAKLSAQIIISQNADYLEILIDNV